MLHLVHVAGDPVASWTGNLPKTSTWKPLLICTRFKLPWPTWMGTPRHSPSKSNFKKALQLYAVCQRYGNSALPGRRRWPQYFLLLPSLTGTLLKSVMCLELDRSRSLNISKVPIVKPCQKPWFLHSRNRRLIKIHLPNLANLRKTLQNYKFKLWPCKILWNTAKPYLRKCVKTCESLLNHICKFLQNLSISAKAYLQILAKVHAFCTC